MNKDAENLARESWELEKARFGLGAAPGVHELLSGKELSQSRAAARYLRLAAGVGKRDSLNHLHCSTKEIQTSSPAFPSPVLISGLVGGL